MMKNILTKEDWATMPVVAYGAARGLWQYYKPEIAMAAVGGFLGYVAIREVLKPYEIPTDNA